MKINEIKTLKPQLDDTPTPEPSLYAIVMQHYSKYFHEPEASQLVEEYFKKLSILVD